MAGAIEDFDTRLQRLDAAIQGAMPLHSLYPLMLALQALRGIDWISAAALVAEADDFSQFSRPTALMAVVGLVPSESSSGGKQRRGHITKTGNVHLRGVLVDSAYRDRFRPSLQGAVKRRLAAGPTGRQPCVRSVRGPKISSMTACAASARYTAVGRELCGYIWEVATWLRSTLTTEAASVSHAERGHPRITL